MYLQNIRLGDYFENFHYIYSKDLIVYNKSNIRIKQFGFYVSLTNGTSFLNIRYLTNL